ncbi:AAA family ATPase [Dehalococcoides mccartyi]|uniref:AAA family ATPase n=1 Tax=Dehalococcoides mccartyi TaxID=61435 RepID=UPI0006BD12A6|nr:AAA family ATPase [Dehalococcoides mccartyi]BAS31144.1 hypothetical protein IBK_0069 [Dehalococcoides mccartyi IBARAKI]
METDRLIEGVVKIRGYMRCGKTASMVALAVNEISLGHYTPDKVISNVSIPSYGIVQKRNSEIIDFLARMKEDQLRGWLILIDEADQLFSHRGYSSKQQSQVLVNVWQAMKLDNMIIYTMHEGLGVDLIFRDATLMSLLPEIVGNKIVIYTIDGRYGGEPYLLEIAPASEVFKLYNTKEAVY